MPSIPLRLFILLWPLLGCSTLGKIGQVLMDPEIPVGAPGSQPSTLGIALVADETLNPGREGQANPLELQIVRLILKQGGVRMRVRVHEPRQDEPTLHIDHVAFQRQLELVSDAQDRISLHGHPAAREETVFSVDGQYRAVCNREEVVFLH